MLNSFQHLTASLYLPPSLGEILKQVQDDHLLWAIVICYIEEHKNIFLGDEPLYALPIPLFQTVFCRRMSCFPRT